MNVQIDRRVLTVTQGDLDEGIRESCDYCPVARAAKRAGFEHPAVLTFYGNSVVRLFHFYLGRRYWTPIPPVGASLVYLYDLGQKDRLKPQSFTVDYPGVPA